MKLSVQFTKKRILLVLFLGLFSSWLLVQFPAPWHPNLAQWVEAKLDDGKPIELNMDGSVSLATRFQDAMNHSVDDNWAVDLAQHVGLNNHPDFVVNWYRKTLGVEVRKQRLDGFPLIRKFVDEPIVRLSSQERKELRSCLQVIESELDAMVTATRKSRFSSLPRNGVDTQFFWGLCHLFDGVNDLCISLGYRAGCRIVDSEFVGATHDTMALLRIGKSLRNNRLFIWANRGVVALEKVKDDIDIPKLINWLGSSNLPDSEKLELAVEWFKHLEGCVHNPSLAELCGETNRLFALDLLQWLRYGDDELLGVVDGTSQKLVGGTKWVDWSVVADIYFESQTEFMEVWQIEDPADRISAISALSDRLQASSKRQLQPSAWWKIVLSSGSRSVRAGEIACTRLPTFTSNGGPFDSMLASEKRDLQNTVAYRALARLALETIFEIENGRVPTVDSDLRPTYEKYSESGVSWADFEKSASAD